MQGHRTKLLLFLGPLLFFIPYFFVATSLDLSLSRYFFEKGWCHSSFCSFFYNYGFYPANIVAFGSLFFLFSKITRKTALYLALVLALGSGLCVHLLLKDHWGRYRPRDVQEFGGKELFTPFYEINSEGTGKSFPCGHCSTGFYFFALFFLGLRRNNPYLKWGGLCLAILLGVILSYVRIAQGGHFLSDTVVSAYIMWYTALILWI